MVYVFQLEVFVVLIFLFFFSLSDNIMMMILAQSILNYNWNIMPSAFPSMWLYNQSCFLQTELQILFIIEI